MGRIVESGWLVGFSLAVLTGAISCGGRNRDESTSDGGTSAEAASGGSTGSGGLNSAGGFTAENSGGTPTASSGGTPAASGGGGFTMPPPVRRAPTMSPEEWAALLGPQPGEHEVWVRNGCPGSVTRVDQKYRVVPEVRCLTVADYDPELNPRVDCDAAEFCETSADCVEMDRGRCEGVKGEPHCSYPPLGPERCTTAADCTAEPNGTCNETASETQWECYPDGQCAATLPSCNYEWVSCQSDADCTARAGGTCLWPLNYTSCRYGTCLTDQDCPTEMRCGCGTCFDAYCGSDLDCDDGQTCALSLPDCVGYLGYFCTTPQDDCEPGEPSCVFYLDRWAQTDICF